MGCVRAGAALAAAILGLLVLAGSAGALPGLAQRALPAAPLAAPVKHRTCGLRLDGVGPDNRCGRYEQACVRNRQEPRLCVERREACVTCAVAFRRCEERVGHVTGLLATCERCVEDFKRCNRAYERRLPLRDI